MYIPSPAMDSLLTFIRKFSIPDSSVRADYFGASVVEGTSPPKESQGLEKICEKRKYYSKQFKIVAVKLVIEKAVINRL